MNEVSNYQLWMDILRISVPSIIVIIGWIIVSRQNDGRERRKEIRNLINELSDTILAVREDSISYYSNEKADPDRQLSDKIKLNFLLISQYLFLIKSAGLNISASSEVVALKKTATGGFFETIEYRKQMENPQWLSDLRMESVELIMVIEKAYFNKFK